MNFYPMNLSISNIAWANADRKRVADVLASENVKFIDVAPLLLVKSLNDYSEQELNKVIKFWNEKGVSFSGMQSLFYELKNIKFFESEKSFKLSVDYFKKIALFSTKVNVDKLVFGCPKQRSFDKDRVSIEIVRSFFNQIASICEDYELDLCIEPNAKEYGCNFLNTTEEAVLFVKTIDSDRAKINFDTGAVIMSGKDPAEEFVKYADFIGHIHISRPMLRPVDTKFMDHKNLSEKIKNMGYNKGIAIEMLCGKEDHPYECLRKAIQVLRLYE